MDPNRMSLLRRPWIILILVLASGGSPVLSDSLNTTALTSQQLLPSQNTAFNSKNMSSSKLFFTSLGQSTSAQTNASFERITSAQQITPFSTKKATASVSPSRTHSNKENSSLVKSSLLDSSTSGNNVASTLKSQSTSPSTPPLSTSLMSQLNPPPVISSNWETSSVSTTRSKSHSLTTLASIVISARIDKSANLFIKYFCHT
ncbi:PREDICTED: uncharacterized protein LOC107348444 [Acropora digitifera]|uniref:uncharacterized protein LOC107348444 n=1 Tax=Acropora digitifera TaxID=70779 RepID=UPI00077AA297|nr:PREDICTED: uncharacterized protein LOC107348444 [Acropora digitifera]